MIEIFKSGATDKRIVAIDSGISVVANQGPLMLSGSDEAFAALLSALDHALNGTKPKPPKLTKEQKSDIMLMHKDGIKSKEIAARVGVSHKQVWGLIQASRYPILANIKKKALESNPPIPDRVRENGLKHVDKVILKGRKAGHDFVHIANEINTRVGGHWLPNDVADRLKELQK